MDRSKKPGALTGASIAMMRITLVGALLAFGLAGCGTNPDDLRVAAEYKRAADEILAKMPQQYKGYETQRRRVGVAYLDAVEFGRVNPDAGDIYMNFNGYANGYDAMMKAAQSLYDRIVALKGAGDYRTYATLMNDSFDTMRESVVVTKSMASKMNEAVMAVANRKEPPDVAAEIDRLRTESLELEREAGALYGKAHEVDKEKLHGTSEVAPVPYSTVPISP